MVDRGVGAWIARLVASRLSFLRIDGVSIDDDRDATEACLARGVRPEPRRSWSKNSEKSSVLLPFLNIWVPPSSSFSFARCNAS